MTPETIKAALSRCEGTKTEKCAACTYRIRCNFEEYALEYIQQLECERDALMADFTLVCGSESINPCLACSHYRTDWEKPGCELNGLACIWSWRGVQKNDQYREN